MREANRPAKPKDPYPIQKLAFRISHLRVSYQGIALAIP